MPNRWQGVRTGLLLLGAVLALSAGPQSLVPWQDWVREGNAAFARGDFLEADRFYEAAEQQATDPGLVAFNRAATASATSEFRLAELLYLRALDDAAISPQRQAEAVYNRGVCLLRRGGSSELYRTAIDCFEQSRALTPTDAVLQADIANNLEVARILWNLAREAERKKPRPNDPPPEPRYIPQEPPPGIAADASEGVDPGGNTTMQSTNMAGNSSKESSSSKPSPGAGTLPVLLDSDQVQKLSPADTRELLRTIARRLERERRQTNNLLTPPEQPHVRDW